MKKILALILAMIMSLALVSCGEDVVLDEMQNYEVSSEIHSIDIDITAADFIIRQAESFSVESNLKYLSVTESNGTLKIIDESKSTSRYNDAALTLLIPSGTVFKNISITVGAAKITSDALSAESIRLKLGAGDAYIEAINATGAADIEGGAGEFTVGGGTINRLELEMGVGELNLTAALLGGCELDMGVGEANITLIGSKDDYALDIESGVGGVRVDGASVTDYGSSGANRVEINGGVGAIDIRFREN